MERSKCLILNFKNDDPHKKTSSPYILRKMPSIQTKNRLAIIFNDGFYHFCRFSTASMATPVVSNWMYESFYKCWRAAQNALEGHMRPAARSLPTFGLR